MLKKVTAFGLSIFLGIGCDKGDIEKLKGLIGYIKDLIISGGISEERINESVKRIFELKEKYC